MTKYNILILNAGRRVELVECFKNAREALGITGKIFAGDCSDTAPAIYFADQYHKLPRIGETNYIKTIINLCNSHDIRLIVPTIDHDLLLLAKEKENIEKNTSAIVMISKIESIKICRDKIRTQKFLESNGFKMPRLYTATEINEDAIKFPLFIKPKTGSSSINAFKIIDKNELALYRKVIPDPIIQEYVEGEEYTVDTLLDFNGNAITIVPRLRMATRSGEISKGKIVKDHEIINDVKKLMKVLNLIGCTTTQLKKTSNGIQYIEINPRLGGGAPMSIESGADSCRNLYRILMGEKLMYNEDYRDGLTFLRFDNSICLDESMERIK
ncbi:MAG: ATP-grasp domain-containing protein [Synergistota bacterium]|nr:ATP-grasp domain-containing protein [Synergistota bacterium]